MDKQHQIFFTQQNHALAQTISKQKQGNAFKETSQKLLKKQVPILEMPYQQAETEAESIKGQDLRSRSISVCKSREHINSKLIKHQRQFNFSRIVQQRVDRKSLQQRQSVSKPQFKFYNLMKPQNKKCKFLSPKNDNLFKRTLFGQSSRNESSNLVLQILRMSRTSNELKIKQLEPVSVKNNSGTKIQQQINKLKMLLRNM